MQKFFKTLVVTALVAKKILMIVALLAWANGAWAQAQTSAAAAADVASLPAEAMMPGFRAETSGAVLGYNPFEPIREVKTDENSEMAKSIIKRLKGFVVQKTGVPLLVIDNKSYKVGDKVPLTAATSGSAGESDKKTDAKTDKKEVTTAATATVGESATIVSVTPTEAVFRKEDEGGFGGEEFKIYYNFSRVTDSEGKPAYDLWDPVATGFFISDDGVLVAPLDVVRSGEVSVQTISGPRKATLFESDEKHGVALLKVYISSIPLALAQEEPDVADAVFGAAYWPGKQPKFCLKEGFVKSTGTKIEISPALDGDLNGAAVVNKKGEALGMLLGQTETISTVARLMPTDTIFRKVFKKNPQTGKLEQPLPAEAMTRASLEQAVVVILKRR